MDEKNNSDLLAKLGEVFGAHKAEWLGSRLFELFTAPSYFPLMTNARPVVLIGGRGTGKTTVLRGLSYEGQYKIQKCVDDSISKWPYYGIYYRVDTNRVAAFQGPELSEIQWTRVFAHYMNLLICIKIMKFLSWFEVHTNVSTEFDSASRHYIAKTMYIDVPQNNEDFFRSLQMKMAQFEADINNIASREIQELSMQGAPVQALLEVINKQQAFENKLFFFLIDEYENLLDYQQRLMNTLIKHSGELYTFKIGVRELGWRVRVALNENEQLISPADYIRIDIAQELQGKPFDDLAGKICHDRLALIQDKEVEPERTIRDMLPSLSIEEEAKLLKISDIVAPIKDRLGLIDNQGILSKESHMMIYLLDYWGKTQKWSDSEILKDFRQNRAEWDVRMSNYGYALLFTLRKGKSGTRKYYSGWDTFTQLSGGNIRYLLQLVEESLTWHLREGKSLNEPISPKTQTDAAQMVGRTNLTELEGLAVRGAKLTKLLLGLGRIFGVMASSPEGHAPEVNQFEIVESSGQTFDQKEVDEILKAAVMHLALLRKSGSKPAGEGDTRDWDYLVHPIFAPFFNFSYRRKRKMQLSGYQLLRLIYSPKQAIKEVLAASGRSDSSRSDDEPLPEQLKLFEMYYAGNS